MTFAPLGAAAIFATLLAIGFASGQMPNRGSGIDRYDDPFWFWAFAVLYGSACLLFIGVFFWIWMDPSVVAPSAGA